MMYLSVNLQFCVVNVLNRYMCRAIFFLNSEMHFNVLLLIELFNSLCRFNISMNSFIGQCFNVEKYFRKQSLCIIINFDNCNSIYFAFKFTFRYPSFLQVKLKPITYLWTKNFCKRKNIFKIHLKCKKLWNLVGRNKLPFLKHFCFIKVMIRK